MNKIKQLEELLEETKLFEKALIEKIEYEKAYSDKSNRQKLLDTSGWLHRRYLTKKMKTSFYFLDESFENLGY